MSYYSNISYEKEPERRARLIESILKKLWSSKAPLKDLISQEEILFLKLTNKLLPQELLEVRKQLYSNDLDFLLLATEDSQEPKQDVDWENITDSILENL